MTVLTWIIRIIIVALIVRMVLRLVSGQRPQVGGRAPRKPVERAGGALVQDPQCGTYIPQSTALVAGRGADVKYFCSPACRDRYMASHGRRHAS